MAGNVWEWTGSWFNDEKEARTIRGGAWDEAERHIRTAYRHGNYPDDIYVHIGFRAAVDLSDFGSS
jgi:formylglycine-generating enzyme required for sulfatase activity